MARSITKTWLPLDRWATIMGISPLAFNQLASAVTPAANRCGHLFFDQDWQNADRVSRAQIAETIRQVELEISNHVGYNLIPDWVAQERKPMARVSEPTLFNVSGRNIRGQFQSVRLNKTYPLSGGVRLKTGIETVAVVRSDSNGDTYQDLVTVTVGTSITDINEIHVFFPGEDGADEWEIKPIKVSIAANVATITFNSWQIVNPDLQTILDPDRPVDADVAGSYVTTVDVYRVQNDPQTQVTFLWETQPGLFGLNSDCCGTCIACQLNSQAGCFTIRNERLGIIAPVYASWTAATQQFTAQNLSLCRQADQVRLWYYSGWRDFSLQKPNVEMDPYWEKAVAYMAAARLERDLCGCSNQEASIRLWRSDRAFASEGQGAFQISRSDLSNPFGTRNGEVYAWKRVQAEGRTVQRQ